MKVRKLRDMTRDELRQQQNDLKDEMFNLRMRRSLKTLENPLRLRLLGRDIARIETVLHEDAAGIRKLAETKKSILDDGARKREDETK